MSDPRFEQAARLFLELRDVPASERTALVQLRCGGDLELAREVRRLLAGAEKPVDFEPVLRDIADLRGAGTPRSHPGDPDVIGPYRLVEVIGEGGFGTVYLAEQTVPLRRAVALKILKSGMNSKEVTARFEVEKQALALLDHPNITRVLDAGETPDGRPYFVMELVRGLPITQYCDQARLTARERLEIFLPVCQAVQHAHMKGIVHRDLKPSNVLVAIHDGVPVPKVIDFGIAKAVNHGTAVQPHLTGFHQLLGTPAYMSPEQAEMSGLDIDTRTDVYSLGVLLYELLTGTTPLRQAELESLVFSEMQRLIREVDPPTPSRRIATLAMPSTAGRHEDRTTSEAVAHNRRVDPAGLRRALLGELDWIVMRCLEKDRVRRYQTADALADDISRHLRNEPVEAGAPGAWYRIGKFARRHRMLIAAGLITFAALVGGLAIAAVSLIEANHQRDRAMEAEATARREMEFARTCEKNEKHFRELEGEARREADEQKAAAIASATAARRDAARAKSVLALLVSLLKDGTPDRGFGKNLTVIELLDSFARRFDRDVMVDREAEATLRATLGMAYRSLGHGDRARRELQKALEIMDELPAMDRQQLAEVLHTLALVEDADGNYEEARRLLERAGAIFRDLDGEDGERSILVRIHLASVDQRTGAWDDSERRLRDAIEASRRLPGDGRRLRAQACGLLATLCRVRGRLDDAEAAAREEMGILAALCGPDDPVLASASSTFAAILRARGKLADAEREYRRALEIHRRTLESTNPVLAGDMTNLAGLLMALGRETEAESLIREAIAALEATYGRDHPRLAEAVSTLGALRHGRGAYAEAMTHARRAVDLLRRAPSDDRLRLPGPLQNLTAACLAVGALEEAESAAQEALEIVRRGIGESTVDAALAWNNVGAVARRRQKDDVAERAFREAVRIADAVAGPASAHAATFHGNLASVLGRRNATDEALREITTALRIHGEVAPQNEAERVALLVIRTRVLVQGSRHGDAIVSAREALRVAEVRTPVSETSVLELRALLCESLLARGPEDEARDVFPSVIRGIEGLDSRPMEIVRRPVDQLVRACETAGRTDLATRLRAALGAAETRKNP